MLEFQVVAHLLVAMSSEILLAVFSQANTSNFPTE